MIVSSALNASRGNNKFIFSLHLLNGYIYIYISLITLHYIKKLNIYVYFFYILTD